MAVFVNDLRSSFGSLCCYLTADEETDLEEMAGKLCLPPKPPKVKQYRLDVRQRSLAVRFGARQVSDRRFIDLLKGRAAA